MATYLSPLLPQRADPYLCKYNGKYYFTATSKGASRSGSFPNPR